MAMAADTVTGFEAPTDNGDGTYTGRDQLDVSGLTSDGGTTVVNTSDVTVTDDGSGNAILSFPGGEQITLIGVSPSEVDSADELEAMGIPAVPPNYIVEGTSSGETINAGYTGDPEGDRIDAGDHSDGSNRDSVQGGAGNDSIYSGAGNDTVDAGDDDDYVSAGAGNDSVIGGQGNDDVDGGAGNDTVEGGIGRDNIDGDDGDDSLSGGDGNDSIWGDAGNDTIEGGAGDDAL